MPYAGGGAPDDVVLPQNVEHKAEIPVTTQPELIQQSVVEQAVYIPAFSVQEQG